MRYRVNNQFILGLMAVLLGILAAPVYANDDPYKSSESILGIELGKSTIEDVEAKLGRVTPISPGEGKPFMVCYLPNQSGDNIAVVFEAMGRIDGLLAISIYSDVASFPDRDECIKSSTLAKSNILLGKLQLGMTEDQLQQVLGKPSTKKGTKLIYTYETKLKMNKEVINRLSREFSPEQVKKDPYYDVRSDVEIELLDNKAISIRVSKTESW